MNTKRDMLETMLADETFRPILLSLGARIGMADPGEVLKVALAILATASDERASRGTRLLLEYPNGACTELRFWTQTGPKLVALNGRRVGEST